MEWFFDHANICRRSASIPGKPVFWQVVGVLEVARDRYWEVLPVVDLSATSGAKVADAVVDLFWAEFRAVADAEVANGVDGVFLVLHGAMVSESLPDVEGETLRRMRGIEHLSDAPVCGVLDLHADFTEAMARQCDGLIAHRENPRADAREAAKDAALLLDGLMQTEDRTVTVWDHPPVTWPPSGTATDSEPMSALEERAREVEARSSDTLVVDVLAGFPFVGVPEAKVAYSESPLARSQEAKRSDKMDLLRCGGDLPSWRMLLSLGFDFASPDQNRRSARSLTTPGSFALG